MSHDGSEPVTELLARLREGDATAADQLMEQVYAELHRIAERQMAKEVAGHTLQPTALVHEAYLKLARNSTVPQDRSHFFAVAARAIRQVLVDHARRKQRQKRRGAHSNIDLADLDGVGAPQKLDLVEFNDILDRLAQLDERQARVVELRFFGGMTVPEMAAALGVSPRTIQKDWKMARFFLDAALRGQPLDEP
jgi:RNA polymerase sigma factor (TIGR02999 family)